MDVIILDKNFAPLAPVNAMRTLIWDRRAKEPGMFEIHCGAADFEAIEGGAYVYRMDRDELGVIQEADLDRDDSGARVCYAKGYFAEVMLDDRVVDTTENLSGTPEDIAMALVDAYFINASGYPGRAVSAIELGPKSTWPQTVTKFQATGRPVGTVITGLEETQDLMHRLRFDMPSGKLIFTMDRGRDRGAIFSDEYANIRSNRYHRDSTDAPNVVFVAGAGEGKDRKRITIDLREDLNDYAREMYVDARDLQQSWEEDGVIKYYTDEDYNTLLETRGMEKVAGHKVLENFQVEADPTANLVYREDYDVGDWCTVRITVHGSLKFELMRQITAIKETYEAGKSHISITFGDYGPRNLNGFVARSVAVNEVMPSVAAGGGEDLSKLTTTDKSTLVRAVNEVDKDVGDLSKLNTTSKDSAVEAINELEEEVGDIEEMDVEAPPEDPAVPEPPEEPKDLTAAVNSLQKQIGQLSGLNTQDKSNLVAAVNEAAQTGGGGGQDDRIGDMSALKTSHKDKVVNAVNDVYSIAIPNKMGILMAEHAPSVTSGLTVATFWATNNIDASDAYRLNVSILKGSAGPEGGAVYFHASPSSNFLYQANKKITLAYGCPLYGFPEGSVINTVNGNFKAPRSLRGGSVVVDLEVVISGSNYGIRVDTPVDFVNGTGMSVDRKNYMAFVPKAAGSPAASISDMEGLGVEGSATNFLYVPFVPVPPVTAGNNLIIGVTATEALFQVNRSQYAAAMFTASYSTYYKTKFVSKLTFAGWAVVERTPGTTAITFVRWLSTVHK